MTVMRYYQKYFAVEDAQQTASSSVHFLAVLDNPSATGGGSFAMGTNACFERASVMNVSSGRLIKSTPGQSAQRGSSTSPFKKDLGNDHEKSTRVQRLCSWICETIRQKGIQVRPGIVHKAASLAKTDLTTELVRNLPSCRALWEDCTLGPGSQTPTRTHTVR